MKLQLSKTLEYGAFYPLTLKQARDLCRRGNCNNPAKPLPPSGYGRSIPANKLGDLELDGVDATKADLAKVQKVICGHTEQCWALVLYFHGEQVELRSLDEPKGKPFTVIYEFEDVRQFGCNVQHAQDGKQAAQMAFAEAAEDNEWELHEAESWHDNDHDWRLVVVLAGDVMPPSVQALWGDTYDKQSENQSAEAIAEVQS